MVIVNVVSKPNRMNLTAFYGGDSLKTLICILELMHRLMSPSPKMEKKKNKNSGCAVIQYTAYHILLMVEKHQTKLI